MSAMDQIEFKEFMSFFRVKSSGVEFQVQQTHNEIRDRKGGDTNTISGKMRGVKVPNYEGAKDGLDMGSIQDERVTTKLIS